MAVQKGDGAGSKNAREPVVQEVKPSFGIKPEPQPKSRSAGNDYSDVSDSVRGGYYSGAPFTNTVDPATGQQDTQAEGSPGAALNDAVDQAIAGIGPGSSGSGGGPGAVTSMPDTDWATVFWGSLGLPPALAAQINSIFKLYPDATLAQAVAQNTIRTSDWFGQTFPGFATGVQNGLFTDETGYRSYVNEMNRLSQQYNNTPVSTNDVVSALSSGSNPTIYEKQLQGAAYVNANANDLQYASQQFGDAGRLTNPQLTALGQQQSGLDSPLGEQIKASVDKAMQRLQGVFKGTFATPAGLTLGPQGLNAPGLLGAKQVSSTKGSPDVAA